MENMSDMRETIAQANGSLGNVQGNLSEFEKYLKENTTKLEQEIFDVKKNVLDGFNALSEKI